MKLKKILLIYNIFYSRLIDLAVVILSLSLLLTGSFFIPSLNSPVIIFAFGTIFLYSLEHLICEISSDRDMRKLISQLKSLYNSKVNRFITRK